METKERILEAVQFIDENLRHELNIDQIASQSHYSRYHFQRLFHVITGITVFDYILKRRLTESAATLLTETRNILDIALDYQFQSHEHFSRSFKKMFGVPPTRFRKSGQAPQLKTLSPFQEQDLVVEGDRRDLFTGYVERGATRYWGLRYDGTDQQEIMALWKKMTNLCSGHNNLESMGVVTHPEQFTLALNFSYYVVINKKLRENFIPFDMPANRYAEFRFVGYICDLPRIFQYIYGVWMDKKKVENPFGFDCECYPSGFQGMDSPSNEVILRIPVQ